MRFKYTVLLVLLGLGILTACIDEVNLPIRNEEQKLVVEGLITNEKTPYTVRLTYTGTFKGGSTAPASLAVSGALVTISDNTGATVTLKPIIQQPGIYRTTDTTFVGQVGRSYTLKIVTPQGKTFVSTPEMLSPVPPIENLTAVFKDVADRSKPSGYQVTADTKDPGETENYYRWTAYGYSRRVSAGKPLLGGGICCANCWIPVFDNTINIFTDERINGNQIKNREVFFAPYYAQGKLYVEISQYSLSREAYQFWQRFQEQQSRVGSIFDPLPAPLEGNIANTENPAELALGYFGASGISRKRLTISGDTLVLFPDYYKEFIQPGDCRLAYPNAGFLPPENW
ncbi:DUF4249 domain-containing protein [Adhaeribacter pallidiroseus]|uniref:DUF4249 domain-containing protein n=1 Tax=Adhaeribacter pallidiroseus TaxID=2072847 RepID=A0A369QN78_9BACT|nr:DUF4249 domain-containing protein [Adhaeribacter pallidiroseus]RDC65135.1 hypothetical protein AHMF7616_03765 [Adhaeribacter pallidiroseus]